MQKFYAREIACIYWFPIRETVVVTARDWQSWQQNRRAEIPLKVNKSDLQLSEFNFSLTARPSCNRWEYVPPLWKIRNHFNSYEYNGEQGHHPHSTLSVGWDQREINLTWRSKLLQSLQPIRNQTDWSTYITKRYHNYFDKMCVHSTLLLRKRRSSRT